MKKTRAIFGIFARRGGGPVMFYDGKKFTNNGKPKTFSWPMGYKIARGLKKKYPILEKYKIWVRPAFARRTNPESPGIEVAARKFEDFTGHAANKLIKTQHPQVSEGLVIGELDLIGYRAKRDGIDGDRMLSYGHRFKKKSRPLLAVSKDGKQLLIVGGRYEFTEAGIEDR